MERPRGHRLPDVLPVELDPRPELVPDAELLAVPDEGPSLGSSRGSSFRLLAP